MRRWRQYRIFGLKAGYELLVSSAVALVILASTAAAQTKSDPDGQAQLPLNAEELFKKLAPSVFVVEALDEDGSLVAMGSGVAIQPTPPKAGDGIWSFEDLDRFLAAAKSKLIVTNNHVIDAGVAFRVRQGETILPAEIDHINLHSDLCQLRVNGLNTLGVQLRFLRDVGIGERAYSIGAPEGLELTISEGLVSGLRDLDGERVIQTSAAISHGSSGGGLFGADGRLIGITTFTFSRGQSLNFALPVDSLLEPLGPWNQDLVARHTGHRKNPKELRTKENADLIDLNEKTASFAEKAISRNPDDWKAHFDLGSSISLWDPHRAVIELEKAVDLKPNESELHQQLGIALGRVGDPYAAVQELREAVRLDPTDKWTEFALLRWLVEDDDMTSVLAETRKIAGLISAGKSPLDVVFLARLPVWMVRQGENDAALGVCRIIESLNKATTDGRVCLAQAQREDRQHSIRLFQDATHLDPKDASLHHSLALLVEEDGDLVAATEEYLRACELDPQNPAYKADCERVLKGRGQGEPHGPKLPLL
jgi:Flp pilus assembly protein TadD